MRRSEIAVRSGLSMAASLLLLVAGCGGSDEDDSASATSSSSAAATTSASESEADPAFCAAAGDILADVTPALMSTDDPTTLAPVIQQAATDARAVEPPESIADDWTALTDGLAEFAAAAAAVTANDPASSAAYLETRTRLLGELGGAATNVQLYVSQQCGLPAGGATPTS
jgi:hypothetical protein